MADQDKQKCRFRSHKIQSCGNCKHLNFFGTQCLLMDFWLRRPSGESVCDRWQDQGEDAKLPAELEQGYRQADDDEAACASCVHFSDEECSRGGFPVKREHETICDYYQEP